MLRAVSYPLSMRAITVGAALGILGIAACGAGSTSSSSGGTSGTSGSSGTSGTSSGTSGTSGTSGGTEDCREIACIRAIECRKADCTGPITSSGCCPCPPGYVDDLTCNEGGGPQKTECAPPCGVDQVCVRPGACTFDAHCIARAQVTCPDAGLCTAPGCAGNLNGSSLDCVCR